MAQNKIPGVNFDPPEIIFLDASMVSRVNDGDLIATLGGTDQSAYHKLVDLLNTRMNCIGFMNSVVATEDYSVIEPVSIELMKLQEILNTRLKLRSLNPNKHKQRRSHRYNPSADLTPQEQKHMNSLLGAYVKSILDFVRLTEGSDKRREFSAYQRDLYSTYLRLARAFSGDLTRCSLDKATHLRDATLEGVMHESNQVITATAFTTSYSRPVAVYTRNKRVETLIERIKEEVETNHGRIRNNLPNCTKYPLRIYNPDIDGQQDSALACEAENSIAA